MEIIMFVIHLVVFVASMALGIDATINPDQPVQPKAEQISVQTPQ